MIWAPLRATTLSGAPQASIPSPINPVHRSLAMLARDRNLRQQPGPRDAGHRRVQRRLSGARIAQDCESARLGTFFACFIVQAGGTCGRATETPTACPLGCHLRPTTSALPAPHSSLLYPSKQPPHLLSPPLSWRRSYYCPEGEGAIPCDSGNLGASLSLERLDQCSSCPAGFACGSGSGPVDCIASSACDREPIECSPGRVAEPGSGSCSKCDPGEYQDESRATGCKSCPAGSYCPAR